MNGYITQQNSYNEKGYEPVWSYLSANLGSRKLANKFVELKRIPYYRLAK